MCEHVRGWVTLLVCNAWAPDASPLGVFSPSCFLFWGALPRHQPGFVLGPLLRLLVLPAALARPKAGLFLYFVLLFAGSRCSLLLGT